MEFTINGWGLCLTSTVAFSAGFAILNAAQRKAWQAAAKLYAPLMDKIAKRLDTTVHSIPEKLERGTPPQYAEESKGRGKPMTAIELLSTEPVAWEVKIAGLSPAEREHLTNSLSAVLERAALARGYMDGAKNFRHLFVWHRHPCTRSEGRKRSSRQNPQSSRLCLPKVTAAFILTARRSVSGTLERRR